MDRDEFKRDLDAIVQDAGDTPRNRKSAAFLLSLIYCGSREIEIVNLSGLSLPTVRKYLGITEKYLTDPEHGFVCQWPAENGYISFILDMLVIEGKCSRRWDEEARDFCYALLSERSKDTYTVELKYSARREGLIPIPLSK